MFIDVSTYNLIPQHTLSFLPPLNWQFCKQLMNYWVRFSNFLEAQGSVGGLISWRCSIHTAPKKNLREKSRTSRCCCSRCELVCGCVRCRVKCVDVKTFEVKPSALPRSHTLDTIFLHFLYATLNSCCKRTRLFVISQKTSIVA